MEAEAAFQIKDFQGAVVLHDWLSLPSGRKVNGLLGRVSFFSAKELTGHDVVTERNANWALVIEGDQEKFTIPGCQVKAVISNPQEIGTAPEFYEVS